MSEPMQLWRSFLFVPGTRPDRFDKALDAGADVVCVDLEDAVAMADKGRARDAAFEWLAQPARDGAFRVLRVNALSTPEGEADIAALIDWGTPPEALMLPKITDGSEIAALSGRLNAAGLPSCFVALIESAAALTHAEAIAGAPGVAAVAFGTIDYAADIGGTTGWDAMLYGRGRIVAAAAMHRVAALDGVWIAIDDTAGLAREAHAAAAMGFAGKMAIHPLQVDTIHDAFNPTPGQVADAERIVAADRDSGGGVVMLDGRMIDTPVVAHARRTLAMAELAGIKAEA